MATQGNGSFLKDLGRILIFIGILYFGGWGWAALFRQHKEKRHLWGILNILIMLAEVILLITLMITHGEGKRLEQAEPYVLGFFKWLLIQTGLSVVGCVIALFVGIFEKE